MSLHVDAYIQLLVTWYAGAGSDGRAFSRRGGVGWAVGAYARRGA